MLIMLNNYKCDIQCLDKGFIQYEDHMGTDMKIVNAARVSFAKKKTGELSDGDIRLIEYLADHEHTSPFRHNYLTVRIKAPIFAFRQIMKHRISSEFNEMSMRYAEVEEEDYYIPEVLRKQSTDNKQGSFGSLNSNDHELAMERYLQACRNSTNQYKELLSLGVCREQARCVLPVAMYSQAIWSMSLQAAIHFVHLRTSEHAQAEVRDYGNAIAKICNDLWPVATKALLNTYGN